MSDVTSRRRALDEATGVPGARLTLALNGAEGDGGGAQYFLDWKPVTPRTDLELLVTGGRWLRGTFDWSGKASDQPTFHVVLGGWEPTSSLTGAISALPTVPIPRVSFQLPSLAVLRWPER